MADRCLTILVIGTLPPPIGGAAVSLQHLVEAIARRPEAHLIVVNTGGVRGSHLIGPFRFLRVLWNIFVGAARADVVSLQPAPSGVPYVGPFVWWSARLWRRPFLIRMFGGQDYRKLTGFRGAIVRWVVRRCDLYLAQTRELVASAKSDGLARVEWYPTSRPMEDSRLRSMDAETRCRRFVFLSHVKPAKGIGELVEAAERFDGEVSVDVYGPLLDGLTASSFEGLRRVRYRGVVPAGTAVSVLADYHALLLPTYWVGEGYPGTVLEAYAAGLPVIATRWKAIPEVVDDTSGILVEPRDADALFEAMQKLVKDDELYRRLCDGVRAKRQFFNSARWVDEFVKLCGELSSGRR